ncbi:MAG: hypothetical protein ACE5MK_09105 [Acidobacteriota bacterium]
MTWLRYSGTIEFKKSQKKALQQAIREFPISEFFLDCGSYLLIDGIYPNVTDQLRKTLATLKEKQVRLKGKIQIGPAHIRDAPNWSSEEITCTPG